MRGGVEVLFTGVFQYIAKKTGWEVVVLARRPRRPMANAFDRPLSTVAMASLRSLPIGRLFEFVYLSFLDQLLFGVRVGALAESYLRSFDVIVTPDPIITLELSKRPGRPKVIQFVSGAWADTVSATQPKLSSVARKIEIEAYKKADCTVFMDKSYASRFNLDDDYVIIPNGVDLGVYTLSRFNREKIRSQFSMTEKRVIVTVSTLRRRIKGHEFLLKAIPSVLDVYPNSHFYLVGKGDPHWLGELAESLELRNNLHILGERKDIPEILSASDLFVLPSLSEGTPGALLEAMAMELPCVATRVGNVPEVVRHQQDGLLVEPGNPKQISDAITRLLSNPSEAESLGKNARNRVAANYTLENTGEEYISLIETLVQ
jgi:glycosyltransferase involved in cell wall biosynthesis